MTTHRPTTIFSWFRTLLSAGDSVQISGTRRRKMPTSSQAMVEQMEVRQYPAATLTASLATNGLLQIEGTNGADQIIVREQAGRISIDNVSIIAGGTRNQSVTSNSVRGISVASLGGDDIVILSVPNQIVSKPARIDGGPGNDQLFGGNSNDQVIGGDGNDLLAGMTGNDMVFGGAGVDRVYGGTGADRLLFQAGDSVNDADSSDAVITFRNGNRLWSDSEILAVDGGLSWMQARTGNARLLKLQNGANLSFERNTVLQGIPLILADNDSAGHLRFADSLFRTGGAFIAATVAHELAHNWDDLTENPYAAAFRSQSGWTQGPYNSRLATSGDRQWQYNRNATFARDYGRTNPYEDFATTMEVLVGQPAGQNISGKLAIVNRFLDAMRSGSFAATVTSYTPPAAGQAPMPSVAYNRVINDVVTVSNATTGVMNYYIAWPGQAWKSYQVQPGRSIVHSSADPNQQNLAPKISFDNSAQSGYQESQFMLASKFYVVSPSEGWGAPSRMTDGFVYSFVINSSRTGWALKSDTRMDTTRSPADRGIAAGFPNLGSNFEVLGAQTGFGRDGINGVYNCISWTLANLRTWTWNNTTMTNTGVAGITAMDQLYAAKGYRRTSSLDFSLQAGVQKVAVYATVDRMGRIISVTHGSLQENDGTWTSKLGAGAMIRHTTPQALNGSTYGMPVAVYVRPTTYGWTYASVAPGTGSTQSGAPALPRNAYMNHAAAWAATSTRNPVYSNLTLVRSVETDDVRVASMSTAHHHNAPSPLRSSPLALASAKVSPKASRLTPVAHQPAATSPTLPKVAVPTDLQLIDALMAQSADWMQTA